ncbi:MAG: undecaprenyl-diphosphate phosphatase [Ruminococcaceae bacterium]|nr:undecaprenyl-diphosphate phosphatase [Oscillospiraceae bacterium]
MEYLKAIILGLVQGITEFLPISSSGHLSIFQHFMNMSGEGSLTLTVFLHIGTLVAVIAVYYKTFLDLIKQMGLFIKELFTGKLSFKNPDEDRKMLYMLFISCLPLLLLIIPIGNDMKFMDWVTRFAEDDDIILEGVCFLFTALLLLGGTYVAKTKKDIKNAVDTKDAVAVGFAQFVAACLPGISRSGSTISTGMLCGVDKNYMVRYSFVLGTPAVMMASLIEIKGVVEGASLNIDIFPCIVGIVVAAVSGVLAIKLLEKLVKTDKFKFFGYYCLVIGVIVVAIGIFEKF